MNCPNCGKKMEKGWMHTGGRWISWLPDQEGDLTDVVTISPLSFKSKDLSGYICQACRKVIVDY